MNDILSNLVHTVEEKFPDVLYKKGGSRAQSAAEIVELKAIYEAGVVAGVDYWKVGEYTTSIVGGSCTCMDDAPLAGGKKLCKHRLAAMFIRKMQQSGESRFSEILATTSDTITLRMLVINGIERKYSLAGYRYAGQTWVKFEKREDYIDFTPSQFEKAMLAAGWAMGQRPVKQPSMYYHYFLVRGEQRFGLTDTASNVLERKLQNKRFEEIQGVESNNEVFASLPQSMQDAIKEKIYAN